jgi:hypothetical protein
MTSFETLSIACPTIATHPFRMYFASIGRTRMPLTLTIKQVPEEIAEALRRRAEANHRSQQRELLLILERAVTHTPTPGLHLAEPAPASYGSRASASKASKGARGTASGKLTLDQLWQRARKLGATMPDESTDIIRRDRDARHRR